MGARDVTSPPGDGAPTEEFVEEWRDNAYGCFSSGHKFCREVCPVMQVTRNENHTPDGVPREHRRDGEGARRRRGRRRRLRPLHAVRRLRAALPEHALHRRLLPPPHAHGRRRQGDARADRRAPASPARLAALERAPDERRNEPVLGECRSSQEHVADWATASTSRSAARRSCSSTARPPSTAPRMPRAFAQLLQAAGVEFGLMREQWCCGGPAAEMGYVDQARALRRAQRRRLARGRGEADHRARPARLHRVHRGLPDATSATTTSSRSCSASSWSPSSSASGRLELTTPVERTVTYHDPCRLNKRKGIHEAPREILRAMPGLTFNDVDHVTQWSYCSGAGGGLSIETSRLDGGDQPQPHRAGRGARGRHARLAPVSGRSGRSRSRARSRASTSAT